jgi:hypothetical protein
MKQGVSKMTIEFLDVVDQLKEEVTEEQKINTLYDNLTKNNTSMFERIKSVGSDYDQESADTLISLIKELENHSPLPLSYKLACDYIESSGLKVNHP